MTPDVEQLRRDLFIGYAGYTALYSCRTCQLVFTSAKKANACCIEDGA